MTPEEMLHLREGDSVKHKITNTTYMVTGNYGDHVTAVRTTDITNPMEWDIVLRRTAL